MLKQRLATSLVLLTSFILALFFFSAFYWSMLVLVVMMLAAVEWSRLVNLRPNLKKILIIFTIMFGAFQLPTTGMHGFDLLSGYVKFWEVLLGAVFWLIIAPIWLLRRYQCKSSIIMMLLGCVILLSSGQALILLRNISPWIALYVLVTTWLSDTAAYFSGKYFGKHKLAPEISPGKTWEGVLGAYVAVSCYAVILLCFGYSLWILVVIWALTLLGIVGDLFESLLKRQTGIKNSGEILPGHGGVLDRIDSLVATLPVASFFAFFPLFVRGLIG